MKLSIARNAGLNLLAGFLPAILAIVTVPAIVRGLGTEGYGLFSLVTSIVGYFALMDTNITAGSTKFIAEQRVQSREAELHETVTFGLMFYLGIGLAGLTALFFGAPWLVQRIFSVPEGMTALGVLSLKIAAVGFALGQLQTYLLSVPQALLRYDITAKIETSFGIAVPLSSVLVLAVGGGLPEVLWARVGLSALNCAVLWHVIKRELPSLRLVRPRAPLVRQLMSFSAFSFLSRAAALTNNHADKLIIGATVGVQQLAFYTVAATLGNRVLGLMYRASAVLFPAASALAAAGETERLAQLYLRACRYITYVNAVALALIAGFAHPLLSRWMSPEFAQQGALVLQLVALAQFVDSLTNVSSLINDGLGHPRWSGMFAVTRAVVGIVLVSAGVHWAGITGAASGHVLASLLMSTAFLAFVHGRTVPCRFPVWVLRALMPSIGAAACLTLALAVAVPHVQGSLIAMSGLALSCGLVAAIYGWWIVLMTADRAPLVETVRRRLRR